MTLYDTNQLLKNTLRELSFDFNTKLHEHLVNILARHGYTFKSTHELIVFCGKRLTRISIGRDAYMVYLDYKDEVNNGILITSYSDKVEIKIEGSKVTATIGRDII